MIPGIKVCLQLLLIWLKYALAICATIMPLSNFKRQCTNGFRFILCNRKYIRDLFYYSIKDSKIKDAKYTSVV